MSDSKIVDEITIESDDEDLGNVSISPVVLPVSAKKEKLETVNGHDDDVNGKESVDSDKSNNKMSSNCEPIQAISIVDFEGDGNTFDPPPTCEPIINSVIMSSNSLVNGEENRFSIEADSEPSSSINIIASMPSGQPKVPNEVEAAKKKRRKRPYWGGTEHGHPVGPKQPLIVLDKLSDSLIKQAFPDFCGDKGHNCKEGTKCRWQKPKTRTPKPKPAANDPITITNSTSDSNPPAQVLGMEIGHSSSIINSIASSVETPNFPVSSGPHPSVGDFVSFRLKKASSNPVIDLFSETKTARVISYFQDVQLMEVAMSKPEFACVTANGERYLANEMIIDWSTVVDGKILRQDVPG